MHLSNWTETVQTHQIELSCEGNFYFEVTLLSAQTVDSYVDGGVHASDGGRCHPSIRGDIYVTIHGLHLYVCSYV